MAQRRLKMAQDSRLLLKSFTNMLEIPPACRVAQWGLSAWRHNRPTIFSTTANTGNLSLVSCGPRCLELKALNQSNGSKMAQTASKMAQMLQGDTTLPHYGARRPILGYSTGSPPGCKMAQDVPKMAQARQAQAFFTTHCLIS